jgi:hypothetical protein
VLERERRERLEAQEKVNQLMREYLSLEFERELQRLTQEQGLEREGRTHKHRERQCLGEEQERGRMARSGDQRNIQRFERDLRELRHLLEVRQPGSQGSEEGLMNIPLSKQQPLGFHRDWSESDEHSSVCGARAAHLRTAPQAHRIVGPGTESISTYGLGWDKGSHRNLQT